MILDIVTVREDSNSGELQITRNGRAVGEIKFQKQPVSTVWQVNFGERELTVSDNTNRATTDMISAFQIDVNGTFAGVAYQVHSGTLFNKYDIYELRYQSLPYQLYPIAPSDCKALPVFYGNWQVASVEHDTTETGLARKGQILAEDDKAAIVALIFFCYTRSNAKPLVSVTNKKLLGKIDRAFLGRVKP